MKVEEEEEEDEEVEEEEEEEKEKIYRALFLNLPQCFKNFKKILNRYLTRL